MWNKLAPIAIKVVEEVLAECNERGKGKALVEVLRKIFDFSTLFFTN
jgi:hypothetical protein